MIYISMYIMDVKGWLSCVLPWKQVTQPVSLLEWFSNFYEECQPQSPSTVSRRSLMKSVLGT